MAQTDEDRLFEAGVADVQRGFHASPSCGPPAKTRQMLDCCQLAAIAFTQSWIVVVHFYAAGSFE